MRGSTLPSFRSRSMVIRAMGNSFSQEEGNASGDQRNGKTRQGTRWFPPSAPQAVWSQEPFSSSSQDGVASFIHTMFLAPLLRRLHFLIVFYRSVGPQSQLSSQ